jgi:two-component system, cell cycle sensor histidine kinase and response regulator CckA
MARQAPLQILVADDEAPIRMLIKRCLAEPRFQIVEAASGEEALVCAGDASALDLLITDEIMPGIHGHELARQLKARNAKLKVLYLTGFSDTLFDAKQRMLEAEAYLDKPFTPQGLREAIALLMVERLKF